MAPSWRERWPALALQGGAVLGAVGMVAGTLAAGDGLGQVGFTAVLMAAFVVLVWLYGRATLRRLALTGPDRTPEKEPLKLVLIGLTALTVVLWLLAAYGIFWAVAAGGPGNGWFALAYLGVAICLTGATFMVRQARQEWVARYRKDWPTE